MMFVMESRFTCDDNMGGVFHYHIYDVGYEEFVGMVLLGGLVSDVIEE